MLVALPLPGLNGLGVAKRIRQMPLLEHVKRTARSTNRWRFPNAN